MRTWPKDIGCAWEFRHPSWEDDATMACLSAHGASLCVADTDEKPVTSSLPVTTDTAYVRLRRRWYGGQDLAAWQARLARRGVSQRYVFFKHEESGAGPKLASAFLARLEASTQPMAQDSTRA